MLNQLSIQKTAKLLDINPQTLRRWDKSGRLKADRKQTGRISRYFYNENDIEEFLSADFRALHKTAHAWAFNKLPAELPPRFYCPDKSIFKGRLSRFERDLGGDPKFTVTYPLIVAVAGEIGNNSFDHNLGNWPGVVGTFFGYAIGQRKVILADRGLGLLKTLRRVRPHLSGHADALVTAFTEFISGRAPEARGNGLKYVRKVITENNFTLLFQSGDAVLKLGKRDRDLNISTSKTFIQGTFALMHY